MKINKANNNVRLLIIRSVPFVKFESVLKHIKTTFPEYSIVILEHEERVTALEEFKDMFDEFIIYPFAGPFSHKNGSTYLDEQFDVTVLPFTNENGNGYLSTQKFMLNLRSSKSFTCTSSGIIRRFTRFSYLLALITNSLNVMCQLTIGIIIFFVTLPLSIFFYTTLLPTTRKKQP